MKTRSTTALAHYPILESDFADEESGVRHIRLRDPEVGVAIVAFSTDRDRSDPTPVYARPYTMIGDERLDAGRDYFLGTRFGTGVIEGATWEEEMLSDGASDVAITTCRAYLQDHAI